MIRSRSAPPTADHMAHAGTAFAGLAERRHGSWAQRAGLTSCISNSLGWLACNRLPRRAATFSQFVPWKSRVKSVIEERLHEVVEECDLGPAIEPDRYIRHVRRDCSGSSSPQVPTFALLIAFAI